MLSGPFQPQEQTHVNNLKGLSNVMSKLLKVNSVQNISLSSPPCASASAAEPWDVRLCVLCLWWVEERCGGCLCDFLAPSPPLLPAVGLDLSLLWVGGTQVPNVGKRREK